MQHDLRKKIARAAKTNLVKHKSDAEVNDREVKEPFESKNVQQQRKRRPRTEATTPQSFHTTSTPVSGEAVFPPKVPNTRRTHAVSEKPGND
ncbi:hypothetical protein OS493_039459 [Desmophyllum pertusum]|uniref:Uncharacterized protein n=1 Tax=Desmophyllum pertusum TaxID=174260 RepID=A0A9W9YIP2_9CNID|nr:hypothetical protein OS493_039459 [Desmophyllum pertusum]